MNTKALESVLESISIARRILNENSTLETQRAGDGEMAHSLRIAHRELRELIKAEREAGR